ncbi:hypothetical protein Ais01nite_42320 [Asanoa ishikariensis]|nr:hypothetical protein Ais01nite_42320 [Asanoa ishikariensis]
MPRQTGQQGVPAAPVDRTHPAQVPVELAVREEVGERELVHGRRATVGLHLGRGELVDQAGRRDQPADPQPGRQRLARRARVDHPVRVEALQSADRRAVVAVLGVVVVLHHDRVVLPRPTLHRRPGRRRQHATGRPLVGRSQHQRVGRHPGQGRHVDAVGADRHADHLEAGGPRMLPGIVVG